MPDADEGGRVRVTRDCGHVSEYPATAPRITTEAVVGAEWPCWSSCDMVPTKHPRTRRLTKVEHFGR